MSQVIEAIYDNGVLRPVAPLEGVVQGQRIRITAHIDPVATDATRREADLIQRLEEQGIVEKPAPRPMLEPVSLPLAVNLQGPPLSETILAERAAATILSTRLFSFAIARLVRQGHASCQDRRLAGR